MPRERTTEAADVRERRAGKSTARLFDSTVRPSPLGDLVSAPPPPARDDVALDRTAAYLQTAATPDDAEGFRAAAGLALACLDAVANVASV